MDVSYTHTGSGHGTPLATILCVYGFVIWALHFTGLEEFVRSIDHVLLVPMLHLTGGIAGFLTIYLKVKSISKSKSEKEEDNQN